MKKIITFKVGETYACRSVCDHECIFSAKVISRTAKTITFEDKSRGVFSCRVNKYLTDLDGCETLFPYGKYSMAPIFRANRTLEIVRAA